MGYCSLDVGIIVSSNGTARMDHDREQLIHIGTLEIGGGRREEEGGRRRREEGGRRKEGGREEEGKGTLHIYT